MIAGILLLVAIAASFWLLMRDGPLEISADAPTRNSAHDSAPPSPSHTVPRSALNASRRNDSGEKPNESFAVAAGSVASEAVTDRPRSRPTRPQPSQTGDAPWISALPDPVRHSIPKLVITIHVYAPDARRRILYINNRPLQPGDEIEGVTVENIVPEGAILNLNGQRFRIPRPS